MSAILKNCPFCGGEAKLYPPTYAEDNPSEIVGPACVNCHDCCAAIVGTWEDDAIEAWNRRDAVQQIGGAPDDLHNIMKLLFADMTPERLNEVCGQLLSMRNPALAKTSVQP